MSSGIYCILCTANGKRYVGQSRNVQKRLSGHLSKLRHGQHHNIHLQAAFQKYGAESFETAILELCEEGMLDIRERTWISYLQATNHDFGFNHESGGTTKKQSSDETRARISEARRKRHISDETRARVSKTMRQLFANPETRAKMLRNHHGRPHTPEARARMSEGLRQRYTNREARAKLSEALRGKKHTPARRARISEANRGRKLTPETRARMSEAHRGMKATPETRAKQSEAMKLYWAGKKAAATHPEGDKYGTIQS